jgi:hypothetical protein
MDGGTRGFNQICSRSIPMSIPIALLDALWHPCHLENMNQKKRIPLRPLETGQVWRMEDSRLQIELVGKHLVHYKLIKSGAKRTPMSLSNKKSVEKYLKDNQAVLVQG